MDEAEVMHELARMLLETGRRPNTLYLGDDTARALGMTDLDAYRDENGVVRIDPRVPETKES